MAQLNCVVGDIEGNAARILDAAETAHALGADLLVTPELALTGYPPEDLLLRPDFIRHCEQQLQLLANQLPALSLIIGHPHLQNGQLYNAASVLQSGQVKATYHKHCLPNYAVFDEKRYFTAGSQACVVDISGVQVGITICEDGWCGDSPFVAAKAAGAQLLVNLNASPYHTDKQCLREDTLAGRARNVNLPLVYVNLVGGQDELIFDGGSFVLNAEGLITQRAPACEVGVFLASFEQVAGDLQPMPGPMAALAPIEEQVYAVLRLAIDDYVKKNGFRGVVLGLSGGIDSALTLAIAVDALGADRVEAVMMPSAYTSDMSLEDARAEAEILGVRYSVIPIGGIYKAFEDTLASEFAGLDADVTEENIQARIRGNLLMAISNKKGLMVLTTGNKSEMAVGYATLYGDMAGGYAAIKDVPKTLVYRLAQYRNQTACVIPERVITRPPSAELRPDQKDSDSLPPYDILDPIIEAYVEQDRSAAEITAMGYPEETVRRVLRLIDINEYKRRQAAPGVRISARAFGKDRRYPITNRYRTWKA